MDWRDYITSLRNEWVGRTVEYDGQNYKVLDVDYNGALLINKKARFTDDTAVSVTQVKVIE